MKRNTIPEISILKTIFKENNKRRECNGCCIVLEKAINFMSEEFQFFYKSRQQMTLFPEKLKQNVFKTVNIYKNNMSKSHIIILPNPWKCLNRNIFPLP